jgi:hypothetical protein
LILTADEIYSESGVENLERLNPLPSFRKMVKIE